MTPLNFEHNHNGKVQQRPTDSKGALELPTKLVKQLSQLEMDADEEKKQENIWQATKGQFLSKRMRKI